jgi:hypothetical protein
MASGGGVAPREPATPGLHPEPADGAGPEHVGLRGPPHRYRPLRARLAGAPPHLRQGVLLVVLMTIISIGMTAAPRPLRRFFLQRNTKQQPSIIDELHASMRTRTNTPCIAHFRHCRSRVQSCSSPPTSGLCPRSLGCSNAGCRCVGTQSMTSPSGLCKPDRHHQQSREPGARSTAIHLRNCKTTTTAKNE